MDYWVIYKMVKKTQILIVGAGPTGLTLANLLAKLGVDFRIIDKKDRPSKDSKAFGIHARSLEIFDQIGIAESAIRKGNIDIDVNVYRKDKEVAGFSIKNILPGETPFPHFLILPQNITEKLLFEALEKKNHQILWQHELIGFEKVEKGLRVEIRAADGNILALDTTYIIGCDGADSKVRKKGNFSFIGKSFKPQFFLADVEIETPLKHGDVYLLLGPVHLSLLFSYNKKNTYRLFNFVNGAIPQNEKEKLNDHDVRQILASNPYIKTDIEKLEWTSIFKIHSRIANRFQKGNIFLAGDAAHVHSPVGAQGMNTGIQDAYNLAWKLGLILSGKAGDNILHSYHEERYPFARRLYYSTDIYFQTLIKTNFLVDFFRLNIFPYAFGFMSIPFIKKQVFRVASQIAINYRGSSLSKNKFTNPFLLFQPKAGDRAAWVEIQHKENRIGLYDLFDYRFFTLILTGTSQDLPKFKELLLFIKKNKLLPIKVYYLTADKNKAFYKKYSIKSSALILIRPDEHIAFISNKIDKKEIEGYLNDILLST